MKFSLYNMVSEIDDGLIIVNTKNSKYVKLNKQPDVEHFITLYNGDLALNKSDEMVNSLYKQGYIVDDEINEYLTVKENIDEFYAPYKKTLQMILYITMQCNFRCVYCPEKHYDKHFSDDLWQSIYLHIEKGINDGVYNTINLTFFGGEPLLEIDRMLLFLEKLDKLSKRFPSVKFIHEIVTNGYLLTPDIYDKLVNYNVLLYQITIDGFAETHNKLRHLIGGQGTWDKIIDNLKYINNKKDKAKISLRANYNDSNADTMEKYRQWELETFDNPKFEFKYVPVTELSEFVPHNVIINESSTLDTAIREDLNNGFKMLKPCSHVCNATYPNFYTISVDGKIAICENISSEAKELYIGYIDELGNLILNNYEDWTENFEIEACKECLCYPVCAARTCPAKKALFKETRPDCRIVQNHFQNEVLHFIQNKL